MMTSPLLHIDRLTVQVRTQRGVAEVVRHVQLTLQRGETLGLIGESGSGKTLAMLAVMGLLPRNATALGSVQFLGAQILNAPEAQLRGLRGQSICMVFQEPMTALNPLQRIGDQVAEPLRIHRQISREAARTQAVQLLRRVGIAEPEQRWRDYPHQFSGGQRQRIAIASALVCDPALLIADEPTTALDSTAQAQILALLHDLVAERGMALVLISHDLALVARHVQRMAVMYAGSMLEQGPAHEVFRQPAHPYTHALLAARPSLHRPRGAPLPAIAGRLPDPFDLPRGCLFASRCPHAQAVCSEAEPPEINVSAAGPVPHTVRCLFPLRAP